MIYCQDKKTFPPLEFNASMRKFPLEFCKGGSAAKTSHFPTRQWKEFDDMCIRFDTIPECDRQTDRQTDRWRDKQTVLT